MHRSAIRDNQQHIWKNLTDIASKKNRFPFFSFIKRCLQLVIVLSHLWHFHAIDRDRHSGARHDGVNFFASAVHQICLLRKIILYTCFLAGILTNLHLIRLITDIPKESHRNIAIILMHLALKLIPCGHFYLCHRFRWPHVRRFRRIRLCQKLCCLTALIRLFFQKCLHFWWYSFRLPIFFLRFLLTAFTSSQQQECENKNNEPLHIFLHTNPPILLPEYKRRKPMSLS